MKSEFCNWYSNSKDKSASSAFAAGWMSQQSKVDELQKRVDRIAHLLPGLKAENDLWGCDQVEVQIELIEQALKGGCDEAK